MQRDAAVAPPPTFPTGLVAMLSVAAGAAVANSYYNQAFLPRLGDQFGLAAGASAVIPVLTQAGNAIGVVLLAPLGDRLERRSLILMTIAALVAALALAALAPDFAWLAAASLAVGLFATVAQQIVPLAVHLAPAPARGRVLGIVTGGILVGILLARTVSGLISDAFGWAMVFWFAAGLMAVVGVVLAACLPRVPPSTDLSYASLIGSLWSLFRAHPLLRRSVAVQSLIFASFIAFWSTLALHLSEPPYAFGGAAVGLLALVGVAGAVAAPAAGTFADRRSPVATVAAGAVLVILAFALLGFCRASLACLVVGILILDLGVQSSQVANQARVYNLDQTARSRLNTVFMSGMLLGGAVGAGAGGAAHAAWGWGGTCALGAGLAVLALILACRPSGPGGTTAVVPA